MHESPPLAYFITFRSYGTWLHGDERGSVDRFHNRYGTPFLPAEPDWFRQDEHLLKRNPVTLSDGQRKSVECAIRDTCAFRNWLLRAINVRTNHVHVVLSSDSTFPDRLLNALKANATPQLRSDKEWLDGGSPWARGGSKRLVWTDLGLEQVIEYVVNGQDGPLPKLD